MQAGKVSVRGANFLEVSLGWWRESVLQKAPHRSGGGRVAHSRRSQPLCLSPGRGLQRRCKKGSWAGEGLRAIKEQDLQRPHGARTQR